MNNSIDDLVNNINQLKKRSDRSLAPFVLMILLCGVGIGFIFDLLPIWVGIIVLFVICGILLYVKIKGEMNLNKELDSIIKRLNNINKLLFKKSEDQLFPSKKKEEPCTIISSVSDKENGSTELLLLRKEEHINILKKEIKNLRRLLSEQGIHNDARTEINPYGGKTDILLRLIQDLDTEILDFGDECTGYVRDKFNRTLSSIGLKLVDYSEEDSQYFDIETSVSINTYVCTNRAIITKKDCQVVLKGQAFIAE